MELQDEDDIRRSDSLSNLQQHQSSSLAKENITLAKAIMAHLKRFKIHPLASQLIAYSLLPLIIWLIILLLAGRSNLPGGTLFVLVLMECGGRLLGMYRIKTKCSIKLLLKFVRKLHFR